MSDAHPDGEPGTGSREQTVPRRWQHIRAIAVESLPRKSPQLAPSHRVKRPQKPASRARMVVWPLVAALCLVSGRASAQTPPASVTVQPGETLSEIALRYYGTAGAATSIAAANGLTDPDRIISGTRLALPQLAGASTAKRTVTIKAGETLSDIAARIYGSASFVGPLAAANNFKDADFVRAGTEIVLPASLNAPVVPASGPPINAATIPPGRGVCLDAGHGGLDSGTAYKFADGRTLREADVTLDVSLALAARLRARGFPVALTREADSTLDLSDRAYLCNRSGAAVTVSVHLNGVDDRAINGALSLYAKPIERAFAELLSGLMQSALFTRGGASTAFGARLFQGRVLLSTAMPAVIVEPAFLTNPDEAQALLSAAAAPGSRRDQIARAVEQGIISYLGR